MNEVQKKIFLVLAICLSIPMVFVIHYFVFIYYNPKLKSESIEELNTSICQIEVEVDKSDILEETTNKLDSKDFLIEFRNSLQEDLSKSNFDKYLNARDSQSIFIIKIVLENENELLFRMVFKESSGAFIELHRGGLFSLIGAVRISRSLFHKIEEEIENSN